MRRTYKDHKRRPDRASTHTPAPPRARKAKAGGDRRKRERVRQERQPDSSRPRRRPRPASSRPLRLGLHTRAVELELGLERPRPASLSRASRSSSPPTLPPPAAPPQPAAAAPAASRVAAAAGGTRQRPTGKSREAPRRLPRHTRVCATSRPPCAVSLSGWGERSKRTRPGSATHSSSQIEVTRCSSWEMTSSPHLWYTSPPHHRPRTCTCPTGRGRSAALALLQRVDQRLHLRMRMLRDHSDDGSRTRGEDQLG